MNFKNHIETRISKGRKAIAYIWRLSRTQRGMREAAMRSLYNACVRPVVEYGIEVWHYKILEMEIHRPEVMQNMVLRRILGAFCTTPLGTMLCPGHFPLFPFSPRIVKELLTMPLLLFFHH